MGCCARHRPPGCTAGRPCPQHSTSAANSAASRCKQENSKNNNLKLSKVVTKCKQATLAANQPDNKTALVYICGCGCRGVRSARLYCHHPCGSVNSVVKDVCCDS
jgi:hypothetical protein